MEVLDNVTRYLSWMVSDTWQIPDQVYGAVLIIGVACFALFQNRSPVADLLGHINTFVHEASHAIVAAILGRSITGIKLNLDQSGTTHTFGRVGPGTAMITFAGYPGPSVLALILGLTIWLHRPGVGLIIMMVMFAGSIIAMRNLWGILVSLFVASGFAAVLWSQLDWVTLLFVATWTWVLAFGSMRPVSELRRMIKMGVSQGSDADALHASTGIPAIFWCWTMMAIVAVTSIGSVALVCWGIVPLLLA